MIRLKVFLLGACSLCPLFVLPGCGAKSGGPEAGVAEKSVSVQIADRATFEKLLEQKKGKVVLVDCWATWCVPCQTEFPHTVELSERFDPAQLAVISVSMDEPGDQEKVLAYLKQNHATFDNLISSYGIGQEGFSAFGIDDKGIPHYKLYDRKGKLRYTASSNKDTQQQIKQLLAEP
ncbi:MAG: redoxin family protein [Planctomycetales bacterium]